MMLLVASLIALSGPAAAIRTEKVADLRNELMSQMATDSAPASARKNLPSDHLYIAGRVIQGGLLVALLAAAGLWLREETEEAGGKKKCWMDRALEFNLVQQALSVMAVTPCKPASCAPTMPTMQPVLSKAGADDEHVAENEDEYLDQQLQKDAVEESDDVLQQLLQISQDSLDLEFKQDLMARVTPCPDRLEDGVEAVIQAELSASLNPAVAYNAWMEEQKDAEYELAFEEYLDQQRQKDGAEDSDEVLQQLLELSQDNLDVEFKADLAPRVSADAKADRVESSIETMIDEELSASLNPADGLLQEIIDNKLQ